jgi:hypothetical protein
MAENLSKLEKIKQSLENFKQGKSKYLFFVPDSMGVAAAAVIEIYTHAKVLKNLGYEVYIFSDKEDYSAPSYLDQELRSLPHKTLKKQANNELVLNIEVHPEDFLIIPDFFSNIMETTKGLPCKRVAFVQAYDYLINSLFPGMTYANFNIKSIITTSETLKNFIKEYHGDIYDIKTYKIGIPDYFKEKPMKKPAISFVVRNAADIHKVSRLFYLKYPELRWVGFEELRGVSREDFAEKIGQNIACLWIDRIASHGTVPLEAMKTGTVTVGLVPDMIPEYLVDNSGVWVKSIYQLPDMLARVIKMYLEDALPPELFAGMKAIAEGYSTKVSEETIQAVYSELRFDREKEYLDFLALEEAAEANNLK